MGDPLGKVGTLKKMYLMVGPERRLQHEAQFLSLPRVAINFSLGVRAGKFNLPRRSPTGYGQGWPVIFSWERPNPLGARKF